MCGLRAMPLNSYGTLVVKLPDKTDGICKLHCYELNNDKSEDKENYKS